MIKNTLGITAFLVVVALSSSSVIQSPAKDTFELLILHNNDMHARFEQTSQLSGTCTTQDRNEGKCYGGFPRVAHVVKEARKAAASGKGPPVLYLNAGDTYTGTAWFTIYKWKIAAEFLNALQPDAVSLGNGDLTKENGDSLLNSMTSPIVVTNVIVNDKSFDKNIQRSLIFDIEGKKVGLVGYLTPQQQLLAYPGNVEYIDEVIALQEEVDKLKIMGINIIVALGHSNLDKDMEVAKEVDGIDLVIGGHKNVFYWTGENVESDPPKTPVIVTQLSGKKVPVIQSFSYDKFLGSILVKFDTNGEIVDYNYNPIILDKSIPQDIESLDIIKKTSSQLTKNANDVIGSTAVVLDGDSCGAAECNLGNLITDAIAYYHALQYDGVWTDAPIAIIHSGAIAASIAPTDRPASVNRGDLMAVLPVESNLVRVIMTGAVLKQVLEHSVSSYSTNNPKQHFLQYSGIRVVYDVSKDPGSRIESVLARSSGFVPDFSPVEDHFNYMVLMPVALGEGSFGFSMLENQIKTNLAYDEITCLTEYIKMRSPVYPEVAQRIIINGYSPDSNSANSILSVMTIVSLTFIHLFV